MNRFLLSFLTVAALTTTQTISMELDDLNAENYSNWGCDHREYLLTQQKQGDDSSYKQNSIRYAAPDEYIQTNKRRRTVITPQNVDATVERFIAKQKQAERQNVLIERLNELSQTSTNLSSFSFKPKTESTKTTSNNRTFTLSKSSRTLSVSSANSTDSETNSEKGLITDYFKKTKKGA